MIKKYPKKSEQTKKASSPNLSKKVSRFWGNATRLEHRNVVGKKGK